MEFACGLQFYPVAGFFMRFRVFVSSSIMSLRGKS
jgi:hypothetical protein